ncbi:hypothetical protein GQ457_06G012520 [Hibiscus cannabinus]
MADSLLDKLGDLNFITEEQDVVVVATETVARPAEDFACSLVGKVATSNPVDGNHLIRLFRTIWKDDKKFWFALEQAYPMRTIHDYSFQYMCICVRNHNIPLSLMTAALAHALGASIGKVFMTDTRLEDWNMGEFMRVRALTAFFHGCGLLGHSILICPTTLKLEGQKLQYGAWLRAPQPKWSASRPRGRVSLVKDDADTSVPAPTAALSSPSEGLPTEVASVAIPRPVSDSVAASLAPADRFVSSVPTSSVEATAVSKVVSHDPMVHADTSDMVEDAPLSCLPSYISNTQATFVQGRAITDYILVAHEIVHTLRTSTSRTSQGAVFKLDMEKAFDCVEWPFLRAVMLRLGFAPSWVDLIMCCVSSVSSRVCVHGLSAALLAAQREGRLPGVRASKHGPPVNHLLFADDSLVFLRNNMSEVNCLKNILSTYSAVSGQKVNFAKSTAYFSPRTPPEHRLGVHEVGWASRTFICSPRPTGQANLAPPFVSRLLALSHFTCQILPDGDLLHSSAPAHASYARKGLHQALSRLQDGFFWTLGVDSQVRLFRRWDLPKFSALLVPTDVVAIVEIPICTDRADTLIWGDHDSGIYSILSGCPPSRVLAFGTRGLSTGACPLCGCGLEDTLHALRDCPDSLLALRQVGFGEALLTLRQSSARDWLDFAASSLSQDSLALLLTLLWGLWSSGAVLGGFARPVPVSGPDSFVEAFALCAGL